jgi:Bacterial Ig-like domain (group 2)
MVSLTTGQSVDLTVAYTDPDGAAVPPPGAVNWASSDESVATVEANPGDDTKATVASVAEGPVTINAESEGITCVLDISVGAVESAATGGEITAGEPYDTTRMPDQGPVGGLGGWLPGQRPGQQPTPRQGQPVLRTTTLRR